MADPIQPPLPGTTPAPAPAAAEPAAVDWQAKFKAMEADVAAARADATKAAAEAKALKAERDDPKFQRAIAAKLLNTPESEDPVTASAKTAAERDALKSKLTRSVLKQHATQALIGAGVDKAYLTQATQLLDFAGIELDDSGENVRDPAAITARVEALKAGTPVFFAPAQVDPSSGAPLPANRPPPVAGAKATEAKPTGTPSKAQMESMTNAELKAFLAERDSAASNQPAFMRQQH